MGEEFFRGNKANCSFRGAKDIPTDSTYRALESGE
jgi:hypothetical protein